MDPLLTTGAATAAAAPLQAQQEAPQPLRLLLALDSGYEELAAVALSSYLIHNRLESIWVVSPAGTELPRLEAIAAAFATELQCRTVGADSPIQRLPAAIRPYFYCVEAIDQACAAARASAKGDGPARGEGGRFLYVDADTLCLASLEELASLRLRPDRPLAACSHGRLMPDRELVLDLESAYHYFNAGVMLFEAADLAAVFHAEAVVRYYEEHRALCRFREQCALNALFRGRIQYLPSRFNLLSWMRPRAAQSDWHDQRVNPMAYQLAHAQETAVIAHLSAGALPTRVAAERLEAPDHYWLRIASALQAPDPGPALRSLPTYQEALAARELLAEPQRP